MGFSSGDLKRQADCKGYAMNFEGCTLFTVDDGIEYSRLQQFNKSEISDNCLNSRVAWNAGFYYKKVTLADCMCLISNGGIFTTPHVTWPVGPVDPERLKVIVDAIWPVFAQSKWPFRLMYIDEYFLPILREMPGYEAVVSHNPDYSDYFYDAKSLRTLSGKAMRSKRNHINHFVRENPDYEYRNISRDDRKEAMELVKNWCIEKGFDCRNLLQSDYRAIRELFDRFDQLDIRGGSIRTGGRLVAFSLGSLVDDEMAVIHFEKADASIPGLYAAINKMVLEYAFPQARFVNREEDMGIPGLRKSKVSYNPLRMIHKYEAFLQKCD